MPYHEHHEHHEHHELNPEGFARQARAAELESEIASLSAHINAAPPRCAP